MPIDMPETAFALPVAEVAKVLGSDPGLGLDPAEVERRRDAFGENRLRAQKRKSTFAILTHQFQSIIVWLLGGAAVLSFAFGDLAEGIAILVVLALNTAIGFFTELKASRSMEALFRIAEVRTRVRRNGRVQEVNAVDLVPGDIVILEAGDIVTADLRLVDASNLQADESVLTGESAPILKSISPVGTQAQLGDQTSMAFKGTAITQGAGEGIVVATGMQTELGRISKLVQTATADSAPLERRLDRLGHRLVWLTLVLAGMTIAAGILRGQDIAVMIQTGVALAVAAVPEGLPVVATFSLARGMWRMSQRNALITQLSAVETLGATTVILTDKTGTLTENRMTVVRYVLDGTDVTVDDNDGELKFTTKDGLLDPAHDFRLRTALRVGSLCSTAVWGDGSENGRSGDPMELALLSVGHSAGIIRADLLEDYPERAKHAFDADRKMMATLHGDGDMFLVAVKGAPEAVIDVCDQIIASDGAQPLDDGARADWHRKSASAARQGLRLLALATKHTETVDVTPYDGLTLIGLVCLLDPVRNDVPDAIRQSLSAGVRVVMLTGDHADTAATIARQAGLGDGELKVIEGRELGQIGPDDITDDIRDRILSAQVLARVTPETKLNLVSLFQKAGHIVAMTGDGVNDAPALKKADIGIAMGLRGTQVAQEAARMVLRDDSFGTIIAAMRQGRVIFENIQKFVVYLMSCNVSEVLVVGLAVGSGLPTPLLPLQILFLNLVTDVFPAFALGLGPEDDDVMRKPPRDPEQPIVNRARWVLIGYLGAAITAATLGAFALALFWLRLDYGAGVTVAFVTLALAQLWNVFNVRAPGAGILANGVVRNPFVWGAIALCLGILALALWFQPLADLLGLPDPGWMGLALAFAASLIPLLLGQIWLFIVADDWLDPRQDGRPLFPEN